MRSFGLRRTHPGESLVTGIDSPEELVELAVEERANASGNGEGARVAALTEIVGRLLAEVCGDDPKKMLDVCELHMYEITEHPRNM